MNFVITLLVVIFIFAFFMRWMDVMAKDRQGRMKLLEEAVKAGSLDDQTRQELVAAVSGRRPRPQAQAPAVVAPPHRSSGFERFVLFVGWMAFLVGGALLLYGVFADRGDDELILAGTLVGLSGFGLVTYPFVVRELEGRGTTKATR